MSIEKPILKLYNTDFTLVALIDDYQQAQIEHNLYSAGAFSISINYNIPNARLFQRGLFLQFGNNARDFCVIQSVENSIGSSGKGSEYITVSGYDCRYLFKRRIIKNLNSNDTWSMTAKGELCIRSLVADQCGVNAEEKRKLPITNIIPNATDAIGAAYSVSEAYSNLYDVLVTIATQSEIGWAVLFENGTLTLHVYKGSDLSSSVQFSTDFESLANGKYKDSNDSFSNSVYIGGKGTGSERDIYEGEVDEPEGLDRFESYDNQSSMTTEEEYEEKARSILSQYGQTITVSGAGLAKCPYVFREQYDIGDIIKLSFSGKSASTQILSVSESWAKGSYSLSFNFGKPVNTLSDQLNIMLRKIQAASNKSSATASVKWYNMTDNTEQDSSDVTFDTLGFTGTADWVGQSSGVSADLYCITYSESLGLFVVVGKRGVILTSSDGIIWTSRTSGVSTDLLGITYSESLGLFVAVGEYGRILTSPDGTTWTSQTSGVSAALWRVAYSESLSLLVVVGASGTILTSSNGTTWTSQSSGVSTDLQGITYSESLGLFVAVGVVGVILTSSNGTTWTSQNSGVRKILWNITYSESLGLFVVVGNIGTILTSSNGTTWTSQSSGISTYLQGITYSESLGLFVAVGEYGRILTSPDGTTWTSQTSGVSAALWRVAYSESLSLLVVVGGSGTILTLSVPTFIFYLDNEDTGSKSYLLYLKNVTYGLQLTTSLDSSKKVVVKAGTNIFTSWITPEGDILLK